MRKLDKGEKPPNDKNSECCCFYCALRGLDKLDEYYYCANEKCNKN